jgi:hypothetical protein
MAIVVPQGDPRAAFVGRFLAEQLTMVGTSGPAIVESSQGAVDGNIVLTLDGHS